jgi:putative intracellular protease/amidase
VITTVSGQALETDSVRINPDLRMEDVQLGDFSGMIIPCMHAGAIEPDPLAVRMVRSAVADKRPVAVQHAAIIILAKAGLVQGRKYTFHEELDTKQFPEFETSTYCGTGIVREGEIIISGVCPYIGMLYDMDDGTELLTHTFISAVREKAGNR